MKIQMIGLPGILLFLLFIFPLTSCKKKPSQEYGEYGGIKVPIYNGYSYKNGSATGQPGVRIYTPNKNAILVSVQKPKPRNRTAGKEMNSWVASAMSAYTAEAIIAKSFEQNNIEVVAYDIWRKNDRNQEVQTSLPQLISSCRKIYLPEGTVVIESILHSGNIDADLEKIKDLTNQILLKNSDQVKPEATVKSPLESTQSKRPKFDPLSRAARSARFGPCRLQNHP